MSGSTAACVRVIRLRGVVESLISRGPKSSHSANAIVTSRSGAVTRPAGASRASNTPDFGGPSMYFAIASHTRVRNAQAALARFGRRLACQVGQGTVEYVALILLVALVMAGVVAAMKGYKTSGGKDLGDAIIGKIKDAVGKVQF